MRVFYGAFYYNNLWKIAKSLEDSHNWKPVYWFGNDENKSEVLDVYPDIVFQDYIKSRRGTHSNRLKDIAPAVVDKALIDALAKYQVSAMKIIYRFDTSGTAFTFSDLTNHYYLLLKYWLTVIRELDIELVVFWTNPHGCEYILYLLCKHLNIPVLYLDCAYCISRDSHLIAASIEDRAELLYKKYRDENLNLSPTTETIRRINEQKGDYSIGQPDYMSEPGLWVEKGQYISKFFSSAKEIASMIKNGPFKKLNDHLKFSPGPYESEETSGNRLQHYLYQRKLSKNGPAYKKIYNRLVSEVDLSIPYIYFASPYQPEGTTLPDAAAYDNLIIVLEMLSAYLPKDWIIYYKEHPSTFDSTIGGDLYRSDVFYQKIHSIANVKLVNYKLDTFNLIDKSKAVATITGSVGWEALVRGKPCIAFGQVWYLPCDGIFLIDSQEDLKNAYNQIINGFKPAPEELLRFAGVVDRYCIKDIKFRHFQSRQKEIKDLDGELNRYAEGFYKAYCEYYLVAPLTKNT